MHAALNGGKRSRMCARSYGLRLSGTSSNSCSSFFAEVRLPVQALSSVQPEDHVDGGFHFHRLIVQQVRPVAPGADGIERGLLQHRGAAHHV